MTNKPVSGFAKKALEAAGCKFEKVEDVWVCYFDGLKIAESRLQGDCVNLAIEQLGGL